MQHYPSELTVLAHSQNFLKSKTLVDRLLAASTIRPGELVLDLGAGTGIITDRLANWGCTVIAVENDSSLASHLRTRFAQTRRVQVRQCDVLHMPPPSCPYKVFSNIPFDVTANIVNRLTRAENAPEDAYLVTQREAAERFFGFPRCALRAALRFPWFDATVVHEFDRREFVPMPRVPSNARTPPAASTRSLQRREPSCGGPAQLWRLLHHVNSVKQNKEWFLVKLLWADTMQSE